MQAQDSAANEFTVGSVDITLLETEYDKEENALLREAIEPGQTYVKDPMIQNTGANDAYVRLLVTVPTILVDGNPVEAFSYEIDEENWEEIGTGTAVYDTDETTIIGYVHEYQYKTVLAKDATTLTALFEEVTFNKDYFSANGDTAAEVLTIDVVAQGIQAAGFDTAAAAWEAYVAE